ncbi:MAG TPA: type VI secretion system baseplate subunit TssF, partial [Candidatus Binataceae bacterium]|nr:type VI secretion system baseplate subunit TssF [Candidatus Binataceae bacterium]
MPIRGSADLLPHYMAELDYLYTAGAEFGRRYHDVAGALEFSRQGSNDPHVQRLIESFAFLTARLQRTYDAQFPEIPAALLDILYPQLTAPIPSMSIAAFHPDPDQPASLTGISVPTGTELFASAPQEGAEDLTCRFRTGYPVTLWPLEVADARLEPPPDASAFTDSVGLTDVQSVLRIRLRCLGKATFAHFAPSSLRFFLPPPSNSREAIYELLFTHLRGIAADANAGATQPAGEPAPQPVLLRTAQLQSVGFGAEDALLPCPPASHQAYRLLQEYFAFPDKFLFFDIAQLPPGAFGTGTTADLILLLDSPARLPIRVNRASFALGCTPIINLFPRVTEPIRLDHTRLEYRLAPDSRRESSVEIHSIQRAIRSVAQAERGQVIRPLFSMRHADMMGRGEAMYYARRQPVSHPDLSGSEMLLSFVDPDLDPKLPADDVVFAHVMCTNRGLAEQIVGGTPLNLEIDLPVSGVSCLNRPTRQLEPPTSGGTLWRLVSHLSVNHLSIAEGEDGIAVLREILLLYCPSEDLAATKRINGLKSLSSRRIVRHIGADAWRGFCRGLEINLEYDESAFPGVSAYLFG